MKPKIADFPDWFGPMLVKELRQGLKTRGFFMSFVGLQTALVLVLVYHVLVYSRDVKGFDATGLGAIFWMLLGGLLLFITPMRAFNELAGERKANTLELIFMSGLSAWRIAFGKWVSLLFQGLLFLLAVLPYAILRYYFGGVDLAQDLQGMLVIMLACAVLSAVALAISGMPLWVRILTTIVGVFFFMTFVRELVNSITYGMARGGSFTPFDWTDDVSWLLLSWDIVLVCLIALQIAAATVAPPAENHAGPQRFFTLLLWLPLPIMEARNASDDAIWGQLALFASIAGVLAWYQLSVRHSPMLSHCRPFRGWRAFFGLPFQPGWPSAFVFVLIVVVLYCVTMQGTGTLDDRAWMDAFFVMAAAALLCSTAVWVVFHRKARFPLLFETLFLLFCGVALALVVAGKPRDTHLGEQYGFGFLPPTAFWAMVDQPPRHVTMVVGGPPAPASVPEELPVAVAWFKTATLALAGYALVLLICSAKYWLQYLRTCFALSLPVPKPSEP